MKAKRMVHMIAACVGVLLGVGDIHAGYISTQKTVEPGKWTSDYDGALAYADKNNTPMVVFWAKRYSPG